MGDASAGKGESDWCYRSERGERDLSCMRWPRGNRQPLCARTGMAWRSLVRAGVLEPGAPSPGADAGFAFARIFGARLAADGCNNLVFCCRLQCRFEPTRGGISATTKCSNSGFISAHDNARRGLAHHLAEPTVPPLERPAAARCPAESPLVPRRCAVRCERVLHRTAHVLLRDQMRVAPATMGAGGCNRKCQGLEPWVRESLRASCFYNSLLAGVRVWKGYFSRLFEVASCNIRVNNVTPPPPIVERTKRSQEGGWGRGTRPGLARTQEQSTL